MTVRRRRCATEIAVYPGIGAGMLVVSCPHDRSGVMFEISGRRHHFTISHGEAAELAQTALADNRASASDRLSDIGRKMTRSATEAKAKALVGSLRVDPDTVEFPDLPDIPEAQIDRAAQPRPLCDSRWSFRRQTERLIASTQYRDVR